jgi:BirA family biotin operon repressor/biotin-[acetyl-CoA-carboxylase] ligase
MRWILVRLETTDTTMREAAVRADRGMPAGTVVLAAEQTAGRGRFGRTWASEKGKGLYCSMILRPALAPADATIMTLALGLAVGRAIQNLTGVCCDLRWPNDVLIGGRKCAGILADMAAAGDKLRHVIVGIGVNVGQTEFPPELGDTATSLQRETGREYAIDAVLNEVLREVDRHMRILTEQGKRTIVHLFTRASSFVAGKEVKVVGGISEIRGVTMGLTQGGVLLVLRDNGSVYPVLAGSVRPLD